WRARLRLSARRTLSAVSGRARAGDEADRSIQQVWTGRSPDVAARRIADITAASLPLGADRAFPASAGEGRREPVRRRRIRVHEPDDRRARAADDRLLH